MMVDELCTRLHGVIFSKDRKLLVVGEMGLRLYFPFISPFFFVAKLSPELQL